MLSKQQEKELSFEETGEIQNFSSEENTIEQECSTDILYLSTNLRAVIEGSTLDKLTNNQILCMKLMCISKDVKKYLRDITKNSQIIYDSSFFIPGSKNDVIGRQNEKLDKIEKLKNTKFIERFEEKVKIEKNAIKNDKNEEKKSENTEFSVKNSKHTSAFSFSCPEIKPILISPIKKTTEEKSLSSD